MRVLLVAALLVGCDEQTLNDRMACDQSWAAIAPYKTNVCARACVTPPVYSQRPCTIHSPYTGEIVTTEISFLPSEGVWGVCMYAPPVLVDNAEMAFYACE